MKIVANAFGERAVLKLIYFPRQSLPQGDEVGGRVPLQTTHQESDLTLYDG